MSRRVEVRPLSSPVAIHGAPTHLADLRIGGTSVQVTETEAAAAVAALSEWLDERDGARAAESSARATELLLAFPLAVVYECPTCPHGVDRHGTFGCSGCACPRSRQELEA